MSRPALRPTQPPTLWVLGFFPQEINWPGHEADHSPPFSDEVTNAWNYTSTAQCMALFLVKHLDNFTFTSLIYCTLDEEVHPIYKKKIQKFNM
jgi:hypothetical protein